MVVAFLGIRDEEMLSPIFLEDAINIVVPPPALRPGDPLLEEYASLRNAAWLGLLSNLRTGSIPSFLQVPITGRYVRIPRSYWWEVDDIATIHEQFDRLPEAHGWEASMTGAPIIVRTADIMQWDGRLAKTTAARVALTPADTEKPEAIAMPPASRGRPAGSDQYASDPAIVARVIALCESYDYTGSSRVRQATRSLVSEIEGGALSDDSKIRRIVTKVNKLRPDLAA